MAPSRWVFLAFPLMLVLGLGVAHRVPPAPKATEEAAESASVSSGESVGDEVIDGSSGGGGGGMSFDMGGHMWGGSGSGPGHEVFSGSSSYGSAGIDEPSHGCGRGAAGSVGIGVGSVGLGHPAFGTVGLDWANRPLYCVPLECRGYNECPTSFIMNFGVVQASPQMNHRANPSTRVPSHMASGCAKQSHDGAVAPESQHNWTV